MKREAKKKYYSLLTKRFTKQKKTRSNVLLLKKLEEKKGFSN